MADLTNNSPLAPTALPPSVQSSVYERKLAPNAPGGRGPLRFEEGIATDTDVPGDFMEGMSDGYATGPGGHNAAVWYKPAADVMRERAHLGSAAWVEAPSYLGGFAGGASDEGERNYIQVTRSGGKYLRRNPSQVLD
jgi:hypothetical protein